MFVKKIFTSVLIIIAVQSGFIYGTSRGSAKISGDSVVTEKVEYKQDFNGGSISGWESYPPFQDTGFDPYFECTRVDAPNSIKYALMFEYHPTFKTEHEMGFIKTLSLIAARNSRVSFYYKANGYGEFKGMKIVLYGTDGKQYSYLTSVSDRGKWNFIEAPAQDFKSSGEPIKPGTGISGFSVVTYIPKSNPDINYRIYLTGLTITAMQAVKFKMIEPESVSLKNINLIVPLHHYTYGQGINISAELPGHVILSKVKTSLTDPTGKIILQNVPLEYDRGKNIWSSKNIYRFKTEDPPGRWSVSLYGSDKSGKSVLTEFGIWLRKKEQKHQRFYITNKLIDTYRDKIKSGHWKEWWNSLVAKTAAFRDTSNLGSLNLGPVRSSSTSLESLAKVNLAIYDTVYLLPTLMHYFNIMYPAKDLLLDNALIYAVTGDTTAGEYAKRALIIISSWKTWTHPWFTVRHRDTYYPVGELGVRAAFCYDMVYPLMNQKERNEVSKGLLRNCIIPAYNEYVLQDRVPSATSNWVGNTVSGGLSCALAIYQDNPESGDLEPYMSGLISKLNDYINNTLDTAGAWGEGINYQAFAFSNTLPTLGALKNVLDLDLISRPLLKSYKYFLYNYSEPKILDVGDSHEDLETLSEYAWLSTHSDDPVFQWLYMQSPRNSIFDFMFGKDKGKETPPESLPESIEFPEIGAVVFRSGWSPDAIVMNFRSGPFYNHQHFDQGTFQLNAFGHSLITEAGWANYYTDPRYRSYYIQPVGHNTLLLDRDAGSQRSGDYLHFINAANKYAKVKSFFTSDFFSSATGELSKVYRGKLSLFERNIMFLHKKYFVIYDRIKTSSKPHEYDLLFHFGDKKDVKLEKNNVFTITENGASLFAQVITPDKPIMKIIEGPIDLGIPIKRPGYIRISNSKKSMGENYITVLYPEKRDDINPDLSHDIQKLEGDNYTGVELKDGGQTDKLLFLKNAGRNYNKNLNAENIKTDARIAEITLKQNTIKEFAAEGSTNFTYGGNKFIKTESPVSFAVKLNSEKELWKINSSGSCKTEIYLSSVPRKIILNGKELSRKQYSFLKNKITLIIPAEENNIEINY